MMIDQATLKAKLEAIAARWANALERRDFATAKQLENLYDKWLEIVARS